MVAAVQSRKMDMVRLLLQRANPREDFEAFDKAEHGYHKVELRGTRAFSLFHSASAGTL
jgi:hypothetical protein